MGRKMKKIILILLVFLAVSVNVSADEVIVAGFQYLKNLTEQEFQQRLAGQNLGVGYLQISKLSRDVTQAMEKELAKYNLDVGDTFFLDVFIICLRFWLVLE